MHWNDDGPRNPKSLNSEHHQSQTALGNGLVNVVFLEFFNMLDNTTVGILFYVCVCARALKCLSLSV